MAPLTSEKTALFIELYVQDYINLLDSLFSVIRLPFVLFCFLYHLVWPWCEC